MKKLLLCFVILVSALLISSCGKGGESEETTRKKVSVDSIDTTAEVTEAKEKSVDLSEYYFSQTFKQPDDLRATVVQNMRDMSNFEWTCSKDCTYSRKTSNYSFTLNLKKGEKYIGLPYGNARVNLPEFQTYLQNGQYAPEGENWNDILGVQCITSIFCAMQDVADIDGASEQMDPGNEKLFKMKKLGDYTSENGNKTNDICQANGLKMYDCYAKLEPGDAIYTSAVNIHSRLVVSNELVTKPDGSVNERRSKITTVEQTDSFDKQVKERSNSTWWVDHTYSYYDLFSTNFVPVTLEEYETGGVDAYIALDKETTSEDLASGNLVGTVSTNRTVRFVNYTITDGNGNVVSMQRATNLNNKKVVNNREFAYNLFNGLKNGSYKFTITAGIGTHEVTMQQTDFTYSK